MYKNCKLCPWECGVNRLRGEVGRCGMDATVRVGNVSLHPWEEPIISGAGGSGAVFFSGCNLGCKFCQNYEISHDGVGKAMDGKELRDIFLKLVDQGAENINLVTATHFLPTILEALKDGISVPVVYNCGGYESVETVKMLEGIVDIYLPDMKYSDSSLSESLSGVADYHPVASKAIVEMFRQTGKVKVENGKMMRGTMVRHLILPGNIDNSLGVIDWFASNFKKGDVLLSLMAQYTPCGSVKNQEPFNRPITTNEYHSVCSYMNLCGIDAGFMQELSSSSRLYIPNFSDKIDGIV